MKIIFCASFWFLIIFLPSPVLAAQTPVPIKPENNNISDTSPTLSWEYAGTCTAEGSCYLIEVGTNEDFNNPEKSTYTNKTSYTPNLSLGEWYWRVKAKDNEGNWSNFSTTEKITITVPQTPLPTNSPSPTSIPSPTLNSSTSPQGNTEKEKQTMTISAGKSILNSNEQLEIQINIQGFNPGEIYYLKPSFYREGSTNYSGFTEINGSWIKNSVTATSQYKITTDAIGSWTGKINSKIDPSDTGFTGSGNYLLKVGRYNSAGSGLNWSNSITITVNHNEEADDTSSSGHETEENISEPEVLAAITETDEEIVKEDPEATETADVNYQIATIAAETGSSKNKEIERPLIASDKKVNWWLISSGTSCLLLAASYIVYQRKKMYHA